MLALLFILTSLLLVPSIIRAEDDPTFKNTVYLIRNAETNTKKLGSGLSTAGVERSQCLPSVRLFSLASTEVQQDSQ